MKAIHYTTEHALLTRLLTQNFTEKLALYGEHATRKTKELHSFSFGPVSAFSRRPETLQTAIW